MKTDAQLKADVMAELDWDPEVNAINVGVAVRHGIVTLSGTMDSYAQKHAAERAVRRVAGVRGLAVDLEVRLTPGHQRTDAEIAQAAAHALRWHSLVPNDKVTVEVENGWLTLRGVVDWAYQRASAEQCVRPLVGVRGITNEIFIVAKVDAEEISKQICAALERHVARESRHITVAVEGGVVTLTGKVDSLPEHDAAIGTAYGSKGVTRVVDHLEVES